MSRREYQVREGNQVSEAKKLVEQGYEKLP